MSGGDGVDGMIDFSTTNILLERLRQAVVLHLSGEQLSTLKTGANVDEVGEWVELRAHWHTAGRTEPSVVTHPTTWWDAFKERWFPGWAKKRWPPQYTRYDAYKFFPHVPLPEDWRGKEYAIFEKGFNDVS